MIEDWVIALILSIPAVIALVVVAIDIIKKPKNYKSKNIINQRNIPYSEYLMTDHWQEVREAALERAEYKCQLCGIRNVQFNVHHNNYRCLWNERESDVIVLCRKCHARHHNKKS